MQLMRNLFFYAAYFHFSILFHSLNFQASPIPTMSSRVAANNNSKQPRLDLAQLEGSVLKLFVQGVAPSTQHSYSSALHRYISFCHQSNNTPFPVEVNLLCCFVAWLVSKSSSIRQSNVTYQQSDMARLQQISLTPSKS